jgi:hypothetical protein
LATLRCALGDLDDQIPHSGLRIHLECLDTTPDAALTLFIDANPEDAGSVAVEIESGGAEARAIG